MSNMTSEDRTMLLEVIKSEEFKGALKNGATKLTKKIFSLNDEVVELEEHIEDKRRILGELEDSIARKELGEKYIQRNVLKSMKELKEDKNSELKKMVGESLLIELTGNQEVSFKNYCKSSKALIEVKELVAKGIEFEEALSHITVLDRSRRELISRGVQKLQEGTELLSSINRIEHLY